MRYVNFDPLDNRILQWFDTQAQNYHLPDASVLHECTAEEWAFDRSPNLTWMLANGAIVPYVPPAPSLEALKQAKIADIAAAFNSEIKSGFTTTSGIKMNTDITDVQRLKSAFDLAGLINQTTLPVVVDYDNAGHAAIALAAVQTMIIELGVHYQTLYIKKQTLRGQATAAADAVALAAIVW